MKNFIINNNGNNPTNNNLKTKKTKIESQIELLKEQEQAILKELAVNQVNYQKADRLMNYFSQIEQFSDKILTKAVESEKTATDRDDYWLEKLIKNKSLMAYKLEVSSSAFYQLIWKNFAREVNQLKSELKTIQEQLWNKEQIFVRIVAHRQEKHLLEINNKLRAVAT